jgi:hypothetical protein
MLAFSFPNRVISTFRSRFSILAAIAIPQYSNYTSRAYASGAAAEIASTRSAIVTSGSDPIVNAIFAETLV